MCISEHALERGEVEFIHRAIVHDRVGGQSAILLIIEGEVLHRGTDVLCTPSMYAAASSPETTGSSLKYSKSRRARAALAIQAGAKEYIYAFGAALLRERAADFAKTGCDQTSRQWRKPLENRWILPYRASALSRTLFRNP